MTPSFLRYLGSFSLFKISKIPDVRYLLPSRSGTCPSTRILLLQPRWHTRLLLSYILRMNVQKRLARHMASKTRIWDGSNDERFLISGDNARTRIDIQATTPAFRSRGFFSSRKLLERTNTFREGEMAPTQDIYA